MTRILLIEDTASLRLVYESALRNAGYEVRGAGTAADGMALFQDCAPDLLLLDLMLPDGDGMDLMRDCLKAQPLLNVIVITANSSIAKAVRAMQMGAYDFLVKPFDQKRLVNAVRNALDARTRQRSATPDLEHFVGISPEIRAIQGTVQSVGRSMATVFISGESGTGKEACARAIHAASIRSDGPFVPLNCSAIPEEAIDSEVFGHLMGAFPSARSDKTGAATAADGGTLFLEKVCEAGPSLQAKLLHFLNTSAVQPLGAAGPKRVNVRIICSSNHDPQQDVRLGRLRQDLYYRLHVVPIHLPPLRNRGTDVLSIAKDALQTISREEDKSFSGFSENVTAWLLAQPWPGNVRQLLNVIRNVVVLHDGPLVTADMLPRTPHSDLLAGVEPTAGLETPMANHDRRDPGLASSALALDELHGQTLAQIERLVIEAALARHGGSVPRAARELDVSPSTLYRKRDSWSTDR